MQYIDAGTAINSIKQLPIWTQQKRFVSAKSASKSVLGFCGGGRGSGSTASFGALRLMSCCSSSFCLCKEWAFRFMSYSAVFNEREASSVPEIRPCLTSERRARRVAAAASKQPVSLGGCPRARRPE